MIIISMSSDNYRKILWFLRANKITHCVCSQFRQPEELLDMGEYTIY